MSVINRLSSTQGERAGSTFPVPVCTVPHGLWVNDADNQQNYNKVDAARLYALYRLNLLLLKGQRCVVGNREVDQLYTTSHTRNVYVLEIQGAPRPSF